MKLRARELRRAMTRHERMLWSRLRKAQIDGWIFYRQRPIGGYIVDFICPRARLVIELDGLQHSHPDAVAYDRERTRWLAGLGLRVIRFPNHRIEHELEAVVAEIRGAL